MSKAYFWKVCYVVLQTYRHSFQPCSLLSAPGAFMWWHHSAIYRVTVITVLSTQVLHEQSSWLAHTAIVFVCISDDYRLDTAKTIVRLPTEHFPFHSLFYDRRQTLTAWRSEYDHKECTGPWAAIQTPYGMPEEGGLRASSIDHRC